MHNQIMAAKIQPQKSLTADDLDRLAIKICAETGIKNLPEAIIIDSCLKSWEDKFSSQMNQHELLLAFEMNINGDLLPKIEHYQCFSRDYFCAICNKYLEARQLSLQKNKKPEPDVKQLKEANHDYLLMQDIIQDKLNVTEGKPITENFTIRERVNLLAEMFDVNVSEKQIEDYRTCAASTITASLAKKKHDARALNKFGAEIELANQIARIKTGKLITDADENLIQSEVLRLVYCNSLCGWNQNEFVAHIESNMKAD